MPVANAALEEEGERTNVKKSEAIERNDEEGKGEEEPERSPWKVTTVDMSIDTTPKSSYNGSPSQSSTKNTPN